MTAEWNLDRHVMTCHLDFVQDEGEVDTPPTFTHQCQAHYEVTCKSRDSVCECVCDNSLSTFPFEISFISFFLDKPVSEPWIQSRDNPKIIGLI